MIVVFCRSGYRIASISQDLPRFTAAVEGHAMPDEAFCDRRQEQFGRVPMDQEGLECVAHAGALHLSILADGHGH